MGILRPLPARPEANRTRRRPARAMAQAGRDGRCDAGSSPLIGRLHAADCPGEVLASGTVARNDENPPHDPIPDDPRPRWEILDEEDTEDADGPLDRARSEPVRIQPNKVVVSRPTRRQSEPSGPPAYASPRPNPATLRRRDEIDEAASLPPAATSSGRTSSPAPAPGEGRPVRRLLLDVSVVLGAIAAVMLAGAFVADPSLPGKLGFGDGSARPSSSPSTVPTTEPTVAPTGGTVEPTTEPTTEPSTPGGETDAPRIETLALVTACEDVPDCYVYEVRRGDTFGSVGILFGVTRTGILALNPGLGDIIDLAPGSPVRIPTPTR